MDPENERRLLRLSVYATLFFALLGIVWGVLINSSVVIFDGLYSLVSVALSGLSLIASRELGKPEDYRFQFGRAMLEPLVISLKSAGIMFMCAYAIVAAAGDLSRGGVEVQAGWGVAYAAISTTAGLAGWRYLARGAGRGHSGLLQAEADQWYMDSMLSAAVMLGFIVSAVLGHTPYRALTPYIDPAMVILIASAVMRTPVTMLLGAVREILMVAPPTPLQEETWRIVRSTLQLPDERMVIRQAKVGRQLIVDVGILVAQEQELGTIAHQDRLRAELERALRETGLQPWLTLHASADPYWL